MGRLRTFAIAASILFLLAGGTVYWLQSKREADQDNARASRFSAAHSRILSQDDNRDMLHINSLEEGISLKNELRRNPHITLVKHNIQDESHYHEHEATVKFKKHPNRQELEEMLAKINGKVIKTFNHTIVFRSTSKNTSELLQYFNHLDNVEFAEPNYIYMQNEANVPNDSLYRRQYQWNLPVIQTEEGWDITRGSENVVIAVVDTGVDLDHPDLKRRITRGYNVIARNSSPDDDNGHGSHVAGIIASETNNLRGIAGLTWYNKIMPIKVMNEKGYGNAFDVARGVIWAADHGADVINLSLGNYQPSAVMQEAVQYAFDRDVVITTAAGNDNTDQPSFPAAYPEVICVTAVDYNGNRAEFSNYGEYVDVAAPGVDIPSTYFHKQYAALSGTSMAAPHVAALAGLIRSANPDLKNTKVMSIISKCSYDLGNKGYDPYFGSGLIDIRNSLQQVEKPRKPQRESFWDELRNAFDIR
ncbi:subtilisin family serine protease [Peribacillus deserti]|uniref:Subtilisin family serine protease n=1 Tax=Peribacillus deserti TaxID=673318 RepID=A0ABS2QNP8_9BACI|nr:S8 family peptidase [Peribacillus deserti]MBM7693896.1 subtilisin family serine protease [Peribacillus deserti]